MTNKVDFQEFREQAIALRRDGKSRREIKEITGVTSNRMLDDALRGVPPEPAVLRPRAKDDLHARARELRASGHTYVEIAAELGISKSSVSLWVRDMPRPGRLSYEEGRKRNAEAVSAYWHLRREARRQAVQEAAVAEVGELNEREILIAGAIAYWCEGTKSKLHSRGEQVAFINSDPQLIRFFLRFLDAIGVAPERLVCRVYIHESADVVGAQQFWREVTGLPADQFKRPTLKRHNPKTIRKNTGSDYHGCLVVRVRSSSELRRQIEGWASAAMSAGARSDIPDGLPEATAG